MQRVQAIASAAGASVFDAARFANVAASLAVQGFGAVAPLPYRSAVQSALGTDAATTSKIFS